MNQMELTDFKNLTKKDLEETYNKYRSNVLDKVSLEKRKYWTNRVDLIKSLEGRLQMLEKIDKYWTNLEKN